MQMAIRVGLQADQQTGRSAGESDRIAGGTYRSLLLFSFALFVQATAALSVIGALGAIAGEWHISATQSALLITAFGTTFAVSAPLLQMLLGHWVRRTQILTGISVLALGAIGFALAPNYSVLFATRILMGLGAALLSPVLLALGSSLVKQKQQGGALALVSMGISIATVVGVPASAWLTAHFGPRWLFGILALAMIATGVLIALFIPDRSRGERVSIRQAAALLGRRATLSGLSVIFFLTAGVFSTYTMITPIMHDRYGAGPGVISGALLLYGLSGLVGNFFVRRAASSWSAETLLRGAMLAQVGIFTALLALPVSLAVLLVAMAAWPFVGDIIWPSQQRRLVELEPGFRGLALALSSSFLFSGMALGSALGGVAYAHYGLPMVLILSILLVSIALGALAYSMRARDAKARQTAAMRARMV
jgi:predicted MFS family arabinose efflux permease